LERCAIFIGKQDGNGDSMKFALALHTDDGVKYGVTVPDLPGCFSAGDTLDEAIEMAREAIDLHCEGLYEDEASIPAPRPLSEHKANPDLAEAVWAIVEVDVEKYLSKPVRLNISLPEGLVRSIDEYARTHHMTRSGFLAKAAQDAMKGRQIIGD
jgi:predicted RNase H-like HicB family nuclease